MAVELRRATPADHDAVARVVVAAYEPFTQGRHDDYVDSLADSARRDREAELWVATDDGTGEVLGSVTVCPPGSPWREIAAEDEAEFRTLAVDPAAQGRGVGAALLDLVERRARVEGEAAIVLSSLPTMTAAHRLYERGGYRRAPERDWAPRPGVDLVAFVKELA